MAALPMAASAPGARGLSLRRMVERAGEFAIIFAALAHVIPARSPATAAMRCTKREVTVGAPPSLAARVRMTSGAPKRLREIVRRQADAPLGQIEAEIAAHRAAEPWIAARLGRPGAFIESAQHDAVDVLQSRFQRTEYTHLHDRRFPDAARRGPQYADEKGRDSRLG